MPTKRKVVIIGNGVAGTSTARNLRKYDSDVEITLISAESKYFFSRTALMYVYMGHMKFNNIKPYEDWFWQKNRIDLVFDYVEGVDAAGKKLRMRSSEEIYYDELVIATGSRPRFFGWPGQNLKGVQGLVSLQDLENLEKLSPPPLKGNKDNLRAVIVGGGLIGVEMSEMLQTRGIPVTMLVRDEVFWGSVLTKDEGKKIGAHLREHNVDLRTKVELKEIKGTNGRVSSVITSEGEELPCDILGITTGVTPNIEFLKDTGLEMQRGILVDDTLQSSIESIYAVGDCAQIREPKEGRGGLEAVWYVGRMMGEVLGQRLAGKQSVYLPGPWFNSAKFYDIEYQVYGKVNTRTSEDHIQYFWEGAKNKFITVAYHPETEVFHGINSFGIRLRHEYFNKCLKEKKGVGEVISNIHKANFDPEFYKKWPAKFKADFENDTGIKVPNSLLKKLIS
ncbi:MAG: NAD(P)/FAD-dependent oxidoreductase [Flavobacteriales bacterium]|nr:NAD(P)/FAD-dependent oxidoreductase [Flavobacteriales bacterium]